MDSLPSEILWKIFSPLSVKCLLQCKAVCKSWNALISDEKFILLNKGRVEKEGSILFKKEPQNSCSLEAIYSINHQLEIEKLAPFSSKLPLGHVKILGSCNGLVLFCDDIFIYSWNPSTRNCKEFISLLLDLELDSKFCIKASGFCYDDSSEDYKVVLFKEEEMVTSLISFNCRNINWTKVTRTCTYKILENSTSTAPLVNGNLHWIANHENTNHQHSYGELIVYFDPKSKTHDLIHELPVPKHKNPQGKWISGLGVVDGSLCMIRANEDLDGEVLVMKEYGVRESWTTLFRFQSCLKLTKALVLLFTKHGAVHFYYGFGLTWEFNPEKDEVLRFVKLPTRPRNISIEYNDVFGCEYVESLAAVLQPRYTSTNVGRS